MPSLTLMTLPPSPYNTKVRLALKLKGLDFETVPVDIQDRSAVIEKTGQPLTPVLLDGDRVIYDSFGIMRYLDANWPEPRLFADTGDAQREIQNWERESAAALGPALGLLFGSFFEGEDDPDITKQAQAIVDEYCPGVETALEGRDYLGGDSPNASDLSVVPFLKYVIVDGETEPEGTPARWIADRLQPNPAFPRVRAWVERVLAIDEDNAAVSGQGATA